MNYYVDELVIEITRKCNAKCAMCLRGDMEQRDINIEYIEKLLENVEGINYITFSGGEPTLNVDIIKETLNIVERNNIPVFSVFVVTNGIKYSQKLVDYMNDWLVYCMESNGYDASQPHYANSLENPVADFLAESNFGIALSIDGFHPLPSKESLVKYRALSYYRNDKEHTLDDERFIISEGRAAENGLGIRFLSNSSYDFYIEEYDEEEDKENIGMLYLNVYGNIFPCCDFSFYTQDNVIGDVSILNRSIHEIIHDKNVHYDYFNYKNDIETA